MGFQGIYTDSIVNCDPRGQMPSHNQQTVLGLIGRHQLLWAKDAVHYQCMSCGIECTKLVISHQVDS